MPHFRIVVLPLLLLPHAATAQPVPSAAPRRVTRAVETGPLRFEANRGQSRPGVKFLARGDGYRLFLTQSDAVFSFGADATRVERLLRLQLLGAKTAKRIEGESQLSGVANYLKGPRREWKIGIPGFARVRYADVYRGVDLVYYGNERQLEYDFVVAPGRNPGAIKLRFAGADSLRIDRNGDLVVRVGDRELRQQRPMAYQDVAGERREIRADHVLTGKDAFAFRLGAYDPKLPLTIDPVLFYSTYLGGSFQTIVTEIAVDGAGNAYAAGITDSPDFPTTPGSHRPELSGGTAGFVTKYDPTGAVVYSTYVGGTDITQLWGLALDRFGAAYITGWTLADDFPTTPGSFQPACQPVGSACNVGFVAKLDASGSDLVFATYLGTTGPLLTLAGTYPADIAIDQNLNVVVTGATGAPFPVTPGAFQTEFTAPEKMGFVTKLNATGSALIYSTYLGGHGNDHAYALALDAAGAAYITGLADSTDFPTTPGALQRVCRVWERSGGCVITFVTKLDATGSSIVYSTLLGGLGDAIGRENGFSSAPGGIAVDADGFAYVSGSTYTADFPTTAGSAKPTTTTPDAFAAKLNQEGTALVYATYIGGDAGAPRYEGGTETGAGIALLADGRAYVIGTTGADDFPQVNALQAGFAGEFSDAFIAGLDPTGSQFTFASALGGEGYEEGRAIAAGPGGDIYVGGLTRSSDFPVANAAQPTNMAFGGGTGFVSRIGEPVCGTDVTAHVAVFGSPFYSILGPFNLQLVIVWNNTPSPVQSPLAYVMDDLQNAVFVGPSQTRCFSPEGDPLTLVPLGDDNALAPNEARLFGLWFYQTQLGPIGYTPRLLSGPRNW